MLVDEIAWSVRSRRVDAFTPVLQPEFTLLGLLRMGDGHRDLCSTALKACFEVRGCPPLNDDEPGTPDTPVFRSVEPFPAKRTP